MLFEPATNTPHGAYLAFPIISSLAIVGRFILIKLPYIDGFGVADVNPCSSLIPIPTVSVFDIPGRLHPKTDAFITPACG